jgi:Zn-dependent protease
LKCQYCGKEEVLPFKCQFCKGLFCAEHRLPENHNCPEIERAKAPREEPPPFEYKVSYMPPQRLTKFWFSPTEIKHLAISAVLVMGVGITWLLYLESLMATLIGAFIFVWIFLSHEIAHKLVAQRYGLWAEFRLTPIGALITLLTIISPIKIISPGAVMIAGNANKESFGKTAIAGPLLNIVLCAVFFILTFALQYPNPFFLIAVFSAAINGSIAVFNLIPAGILDGLKVFHWSKMAWGAAFALSVILLVLVFASYPFLLNW